MKTENLGEIDALNARLQTRLHCTQVLLQYVLDQLPEPGQQAVKVGFVGWLNREESANFASRETAALQNVRADEIQQAYALVVP